MKASALGSNALITKTVLKKLYFRNKKMNKVRAVVASAVPNIKSNSCVGNVPVYKRPC